MKPFQPDEHPRFAKFRRIVMTDRARKNASLKTYCKMVNVCESTLVRLETGERLLSPQSIVRICDAMELDPTEFLD